MNHIIIKRLLRAVWILMCIVLICVSCYLLLPLVYPFLIAWILAYTMRPFVALMQTKARFPRWLAVTVALFVYIGSVILILSAAITRMVKELILLTESLNIHTEEWKSYFIEWTQSPSIQNIINEISDFIQNNPNYKSTINQNIDHTTQTISSAVTSVVSGLLNGLLNLLSSLPNLAMILLVIILATFFISNSWERHTRTMAGIISVRYRKTLGDIWRDLQKALFGYFRAQFIMISITALIVLIGLLILQVKSAFTFAILIGLVDLLPYLGVGTVMIPWLAYTFMTGDLSLALGLSILYAIILIARQVIEPKVLASSVGLDPLPTLVGMFVGLKLFGILGLIIGPVSFVVLTAVNRAGVFRDLRNYMINGRIR